MNNVLICVMDYDSGFIFYWFYELKLFLNWLKNGCMVLGV